MDDAALLDGFERCTLSRDQWTHQAHVRVAWLHLRRQPFSDAVTNMGAGIRRLNAALGIVDSATTGYHETLTCTFMCVIWATVQSAGAGEDSLAFCAANPHLMAQTLPRVFYSRERMLSAEAKVRFVPPDLAPLPHPPDWCPSI